MGCPNSTHETCRKAWFAGPRAVAWRTALRIWIIAFACFSAVQADTVVQWDFARGLLGWKGNPYVEGLTLGEEGLVFRSTGQDPWIEGPAVDLPTDRLIRMTVRMRSNANGSLPGQQRNARSVAHNASGASSASSASSTRRCATSATTHSAWVTCMSANAHA